MCRDIKEKDGEAPDCETEKGCPVPTVDAECQKALELHGRIRNLKGLVDASAVLSMHGATTGDLRLIEVIEETLKEHGNENQD